MKSLFTVVFLTLLCSIAYGEEEQMDTKEPIIEENSTEEIALLELDSVPKFSIPTENLNSSFHTLPSRKNSFIAMGLSSLVPGLGHAYLGDYKTAFNFLGSLGAIVSLNSIEQIPASVRLSSLIAAQSTWFYSMYATYRDVRTYNGEEGYFYKMPSDSLADLSLAPFQLSILKKPEVWGGLLGSLALAVGLEYFLSSMESKCHMHLSTNGEVFPLLAFPVGLGEESFFRGYLQPQLSEKLSPIGGIFLSSLIFGAMHIPNAFSLPQAERWNYYSICIPFITTLGTYFGWVAHKNGSLKECVTLHSWYDFILFTLSYSLSKSATIGKPHFGFSFSF